MVLILSFGCFDILYITWISFKIFCLNIFDKSTLSKLTVKLHQEEIVKTIGILWPRSSKINTAIKCKVIAAIEATTLVNLCHLLTVLFKIKVAFTPNTVYLPITMFAAHLISFKFSMYIKCIKWFEQTLT